MQIVGILQDDEGGVLHEPDRRNPLTVAIVEHSALLRPAAGILALLGQLEFVTVLGLGEGILNVLVSIREKIRLID